MKQYKTLLFDLDDTLLDFGAAERIALEQVLGNYKIGPEPHHFTEYKGINQRHWEMLERNELTRDEVLTKRHEAFFETLGRTVDGAEVDALYRYHIAENGHQLFDTALDVIRKLSENYHLFIITNGVKATQEKRLARSGILPYFKDVFISEETGYQKPMKAFFDHVAGNIEGFEHGTSLIVGDSLTSDIKGGINSGIDTCWYNPEEKSNPYPFSPHYEIKQLNALYGILDR